MEVKTDVDTPEGKPQPFFVPDCVFVHVSEHKQHQPDSKHAIDPKEGCMSVNGCGVESLHVIKGDRWVDEETEDAGANQVPESNRDKTVDSPAVFFYPIVALVQFEVVIRFETHQYQR